MPRILDPAQIEALSDRALPRIRLPDRERLFAARAERLRQLAQAQAVGHSIGPYLRLMAAVADAQHAVLAGLDSPLPAAREIAQARAHGMPLLHAGSWKRNASWRDGVLRVSESIVANADFPIPAREVCIALRHASAAVIEAQADALLAQRADSVDAAAAPFIMAGLQIQWVHMATSLSPGEVAEIDAPGVCPICGTLPVASIVHADRSSEGYRYLHCSLCAAEWHMVRIKCSQCESTKDIAYHSIEGGPEAIRAESCGGCGTYRKILYQEKDPAVEPLADDLASLALDLLMSEAGYHRGSGNPLLWQHS